MHLLRLTIQNVGVFRGQHDFNLAPIRQPDSTRRHLTIISGHNGSGKSTLFQAMAIALHGSLALGDRVTRQAYNDFLLGWLHRHNKTGSPEISQEGGVTLTFEYTQSGCPLRIQVERRWQRRGHNVLETLSLLQDGKPPDVKPEDYQTWLNDLVPPGVSPLCFFDAERLDALASLKQHNGQLSQALRRLLSLDLVERLQSDLQYYTLRRGGGRKAEQLRQQVLQHQATVDKLEAELNNLRAEAKALEAQQTELEAKLAKQERRLAAEGGTYAARRPALQERLKAVEVDVKSVTEELRELSAHLLPFTLAPELCQTLGQRLVQEAELRRQQLNNEFWQEQVSNIKSALRGDKLWKGLGIPIDARKKLTRRIGNLLKKMNAAGAQSEQSLIHHLAEPKQQQLQEWIAQSLHTIPQQAQTLGRRLRALQAERRRIEAELQRAPDDELLAPIHDEIARLEAALTDVRQRQAALGEQTRKLQFQRDEKDRERQRAIDQFLVAEAHERQLALAERSSLVLRTFEDALTRQKLGALEKALVKAFNVVCRKERLLEAAHINPEDFHMQLHGADGHELGLHDFSAGERQLYALSLLWALRQVSGRRLPLVVDMPLARLDEIHRRRFLHTYIPAVSNQVLLFTTDTELDAELLAQVDSYLAYTYRLEYDPESEETVVTCNSQSAPISLNDTSTNKKEVARGV